MRTTLAAARRLDNQSHSAAPRARRGHGRVHRVLVCAVLFAVLAGAAHADSTGELHPGASTGGFTNAANALLCDNAVASATANNATQVFSTFGISVPPTAIITGIQVRVRANDGTLNNRRFQISLSWNGGSTYTTPLATANFRRNSALRDYIVGGSTVLWGRTWTPAEFSNANFRVRAVAPRGSVASPANLDCLPVTVFYSIPGAPSLSISKIDSPDPVQPGQNITYTIAYSNVGESTATNVVISDTVPANTTFVSASPAPLSAPAVGGTGTVTWSVGSLAPGASGFVTLVVKTGAALPNGTLITNAGYSIASDQNSPAAGNPVTTTISGTIALRLTIADSPDPVAPGGTLTYVVTIGNSGTGLSTNIIVGDALDGNVTFVGYTSTCAGISVLEAGSQWLIPSLGSGASCTLTITTTVGSPLADGVLLLNTADVIDDAGSTAEATTVTSVLNPVTCGDGIVGAGEACDLGAGQNGAATTCCTAACQYRGAGELCRAAGGVCDLAETCSGSAAACPADAKSTAVCRAAAGICDLAEACDGVSNACPGDVFASAGTTCRAAAGVCDLAESCTGSAAACPTDAKSTALCRAAAGVCDVAESCDGVANDCPANGFVSSGTTCRPAVGVCDLAESCTGSDAACPADVRSTAVCRAAADVCDVAEICDGVGADCPADGFASAATTCRAAAGVCDLAESCTGSEPACPSDTRSTAICRAAADACDVAEICDGGAADCPADGFASAGTTCRPAAGVCDLAESCTGDNAACPADVLSTAVCRAASDACDAADSCDGVAPDCPADVLATAGTVCRAAAGACDLAETCTGDSGACPADALSTAVCRAAAGPCDVAESCTGGAAACPVDAFAANTVVCRASAAGGCDLAEHCTGAAADCPADAVQAAGATCRAAAGACDLAETCDGASAACPADAFRAAGTSCRPASDVCDVAETCSGSSPQCPTDLAQPDGTSCADGAFCNGSEVCAAGECVRGSAPCGLICSETRDECLSACPPAPESCRVAQRARLVIRNKADDARDRLKWRWRRGQSTTQTDWADPTATANYVLCLYSQSTLIGQAIIPPSATLWHDLNGRGYQYRDVAGAADGIIKAAVRPSTVSKARAFVAGRGVALPDVALPLPAAPLTVQLINGGNGQCWGSTFSGSQLLKNTDRVLNARQ